METITGEKRDESESRIDQSNGLAWEEALLKRKDQDSTQAAFGARV